jgi:hypothetical protein
MGFLLHYKLVEAVLELRIQCLIETHRLLQLKKLLLLSLQILHEHIKVTFISQQLLLVPLHTYDLLVKWLAFLRRHFKIVLVLFYLLLIKLDLVLWLQILLIRLPLQSQFLLELISILFVLLGHCSQLIQCLGVLSGIKDFIEDFLEVLLVWKWP